MNSLFTTSTSANASIPVGLNEEYVSVGAILDIREPDSTPVARGTVVVPRDIMLWTEWVAINNWMFMTPTPKLRARVHYSPTSVSLMPTITLGRVDGSQLMHFIREHDATDEAWGNLVGWFMVNTLNELDHRVQLDLDAS